MSELVTIYIDGKAYEVPKGANLVDVAKFYADNDIPVFCYHPKMDPVGMCRMCLVELGSIMRDRESGEVMIGENGEPEVRWFPKLQTACTTTVNDGMVVRTNTQEVTEARDDMIEFLLTSHPLDCPICDKGGECPLQNLTMRHGPGHSVFYWEDKVRLAKHVPLGELIYLDRERCIQCARCTRFQDELVGDDVLAFHERGRKLQIITVSDPPFDTYFSGNTTDICPVGALTTADFRFEARPWELKNIPSLDVYGPEGSNITLSTRLDRDAGGVMIIKRVKPRQNEAVNEIWISDKTRFGHHHTRADERLLKPKVRVGDRLIEAEWDHALDVISKHIKQDISVGAIAGPTLSNEDLWELRKLVQAINQDAKLGVYPATMTGGDIVAQVGVGVGTNFKDMSSETTIVVVASDLEEEAPIWWLRTKTAGDRGAKILVLNARATKLDRYATDSIRYDYGAAAGALKDIAQHDAVKNAENLIVICGAEGLTLEQHGELMNACANVLVKTKHVGRPNNGLLAVWEGANVQGAFDLGFSAEATAEMIENAPDILFIAGCDPMGESMEAAGLSKAKFIVANSLFDTETTEAADAVLPSQSFAERDGSFTSGERRVQRFYPAQGVIGQSEADWRIFAAIRDSLDGSGMPRLTAGVFRELAGAVDAYEGLSFSKLAIVERQFPDVGGDDLYYGGTAYQNAGGLGVQYATVSEADGAKLPKFSAKSKKVSYKGLTAIPVNRLYDRGYLFKYSDHLMHQRIGDPFVVINPADADDIVDGTRVGITINGVQYEAIAILSDNAPQGFVLMPKRLTSQPGPFAPVAIESIEVIAEPVGA
jgi:NADH-quinone oxidoreductase subunit G